MSGAIIKAEAPGLPTDYDPEKGLKGVAVAEAAEKYYARAKDVTKLGEAIEAKLGEQRRFVLWWDSHGLHGGDRRSTEFQDCTDATLKPGSEAAPDSPTLSRWRKRLKDPKKFDATLQAALERCIKVCEACQGHSDNPMMTNTGDNEWYTPAEYVQAARDVLGTIDLDPANTDKAQQVVQATKYFTKGDDGLKRAWHGRVWLNPPYAQPLISEFVAKIVAEYKVGNIAAAIMLTNNSADTSWFHEAVAASAAICFTRGRIKFYKDGGEESSPTQGQAFFYFGSEIAGFVERFSEIGAVVGRL